MNDKDANLVRVTAELATTMGYSFAQAISRLCRRGRIPGAIQKGNRWWVPLAWIEGRGVPVRGKHLED